MPATSEAALTEARFSISELRERATALAERDRLG